MSQRDEAVYLRHMLECLGCEQTDPTPIFCDNQACIAMVKNIGSNHQRSKHIDIRLHYTRELIDKNVIDVHWIPTKDQLADGLTKPLGPINHHKFTEATLADIDDHHRASSST